MILFYATTFDIVTPSSSLYNRPPTLFTTSAYTNCGTFASLLFVPGNNLNKESGVFAVNVNT